jgi:hypothetical protein
MSHPKITTAGFGFSFCIAVCHLLSAAFLKSRIHAKTKRHDQHPQSTLSHFSKKDDAQYASRQQKMQCLCLFYWQTALGQGTGKAAQIASLLQK